MSERMTDEEFARIEKARDGLEILGIDVDNILAEAERARASEATLRAEIKSMYATDREKEGAAVEAYRKLLTERDELRADNRELEGALQISRNGIQAYANDYNAVKLERDELLADNKLLRDAFGHAVDRIESLMFALELGLPPATHVAGIKGTLPEITKEARAALSGATPPRPSDSMEGT